MSTRPGVVCGEDFDEYAADTAYRQLGYTNANYFNTSLQLTKQIFWDAGFNCKAQSHNCVYNCFNVMPYNRISCINLVYLSCEFDLSLKDMESSGSPRLCDAEVANKCEPDVENNTRLSIAVTVSIIVIVILAIAAACIVSITLLVCWFMPGCLIHHKRSQHGPAKDLGTVTH